MAHYSKMKQKFNRKPLFVLLWCIAGVFSISAIQSCGKAGGASPNGLNIEYEIFNLSPNLGGINLYIRFNPVNTTPYIFNNAPAYFFVPYTDTPYQFRQAISTSTALGSGPTLFSRPDILTTNTKYSLFVFGTYNSSSFQQILTVDTATPPALGRGKVRFVNVSPTGTTGLDLYANGTKLFSAQGYPVVSKYMEIPVGYYDFQVETTGTSNVLQDIPAYNIQDGRLYTIYAHGYSNRTDSAIFAAGVIINK